MLYFYICSFNFLNALLNMPIVPENKALVCFICVLCVFVICIYVLVFNNKDNIYIFFLYFVTLKGFVFVIGKLF